MLYHLLLLYSDDMCFFPGSGWMSIQGQLLWSEIDWRIITCNESAKNPNDTLSYLHTRNTREFLVIFKFGMISV